VARTPVLPKAILVGALSAKPEIRTDPPPCDRRASVRRRAAIVSLASAPAGREGRAWRGQLEDIARGDEPRGERRRPSATRRR
jgi:hypothetical protein